VKSLLIMLTIISALSASAQETPVLPLEKVEVDKVLTEESAKKPHVLFVNANKALDEKLFSEAVAAIPLTMSINLAVNQVENFESVSLLKNASKQISSNAQTRLVVYVINNPEMVSILSAPRHWAVINIAGFEKKIPSNDSERYRRRLRQLMLKGLAFACGVGATLDNGRCVMAADSFSVDTIDNTSVTYSPYASLPMQDILAEIGGEAIFKK